MRREIETKCGSRFATFIRVTRITSTQHNSNNVLCTRQRRQLILEMGLGVDVGQRARHQPSNAPGDHFPGWYQPPKWTPACAPQHHVLPVAAQIKFPALWTKDVRSWFTLLESTFNRYGIVDSRLRFDLVLPALPEEAIEQIRSLLHSWTSWTSPTWT